MEKEVDSNLEFKNRFISFMEQYENSNHMSVVEELIGNKIGLSHNDGSARTTSRLFK